MEQLTAFTLAQDSLATRRPVSPAKHTKPPKRLWHEFLRNFFDEWRIPSASVILRRPPILNLLRVSIVATSASTLHICNVCLRGNGVCYSRKSICAEARDLILGEQCGGQSWTESYRGLIFVFIPHTPIIISDRSGYFRSSVRSVLVASQCDLRKNIVF